MVKSIRVPKVAVITRTKDRPLLLERAIKSVHQQTMGDFVHVIINDGGKVEPIEKLLDKYKEIISGRVKLINNAQSIGMEAASNLGIKSVDSMYVAIHDDDDTWDPNFLKETTKHMDEFNDMGVIASTDLIYEEIVGKSVQEIDRCRWMDNLRTLTLYNLLQDNFAVPISFIYRRSIFKEIGFYDENLPVLGDWDFAIRFMKKHDIYFLNSKMALAYYHQRPKSAGVMGNSVFVGADKHEFYRSVLENKYLREDLSNGGLGTGYLFNKLRADKSNIDDIRSNINSINTKLEGLKKIVIERTDYKKKIKNGVRKIGKYTIRKVKSIFNK